MSIIVTLNTRVTSKIANGIGVINDNYGFWDPTTGVNLTKGNPVSGDLSAFTSLQLANISNAVKLGTLTLTAGSLPAATATFSTYSLYASAGLAGGGAGTGITTVAAADALQPKNESFPANPVL